MVRRVCVMLLRGLLAGFVVWEGLVVVVAIGGQYVIQGNMEQAAENCGDGPPGYHFHTRRTRGFPPRTECIFLDHGDGSVIVADDSVSWHVYGLAAVVLGAVLLLILPRLRRRA